MTAHLTFPCEPRMAETALAAVVAAMRGAGVPEARLGAATAAVEQFLREHMRQAQPSPVTADVTAARVQLTAAGRTVTVDL